MFTDSLYDMPMETWFVCLLAMLITTLLGYVSYSGIWSSIFVSTTETEYGPITMAYKTSVGPYKNAGEFFTESFCLLPDREQLGIYYDDPEGIATDMLRCAVGPVLAKGEEKPVPEEMEKMIKNGFKIAHLPKPSYVVMASFPFTTTMSIFLAIYKVYPRLRDYIAQRNLCAYPAMEIYTDSTIMFMMPLSRQDEFFVSEFQEEEMSIATTDMESFTSIESPAVVRDDAGFVIPRSPLEDAGRGDKGLEVRESEVSSLEESDDEQDDDDDVDDEDIDERHTEDVRGTRDN
eukprot:TRINITY_DN13948_c0_g1_i1.p1 TRINITY_DN13948_c0_g1~~TRINITY_DN13948_c0_g1_i1.p1  ORF type:complete len:290 (+),score=103.24 TRINITY_DN13948_c0_g1_i1:35-904(+)